MTAAVSLPPRELPIPAQQLSKMDEDYEGDCEDPEMEPLIVSREESIKEPLPAKNLWTAVQVFRLISLVFGSSIVLIPLWYNGPIYMMMYAT